MASNKTTPWRFVAALLMLSAPAGYAIELCPGQAPRAQASLQHLSIGRRGKKFVEGLFGSRISVGDRSLKDILHQPANAVVLVLDTLRIERERHEKLDCRFPVDLRRCCECECRRVFQNVPVAE